MSPDDDDSPWPTLAQVRGALAADELVSIFDPEARVHIDRSKLVKATPLTLRPKPVDHLAPDTLDDDAERDWHLEPDDLAF